MAQRPLKPCRHPGCYRLTADGWCPDHRPRDSRSDQAAEWHKLYQTRIWRERLRPEQLLREPFCRECAKHGLRVPGTDVDHVVPHQGDWALFSDPSNLQTLCHACHSAKTRRENREKLRGN